MRVYLKVDEKDFQEVMALGGKYSQESGSWFCFEDEIDKFSTWVPSKFLNKYEKQQQKNPLIQIDGKQYPKTYLTHLIEKDLRHRRQKYDTLKKESSKRQLTKKEKLFMRTSELLV